MNRVFIKFAFRMALRSMSIHKVRTLLTVLAITWSVATLVALRTVGVGIRSKVAQDINDFLQADMIIMENVISIPEQVAYHISEIPHVKDVVGTIFIPVRVGYVRGVNLVGVPVSKMKFFHVNLVDGRLPASDDSYEIVIDEKLAEWLGIKKPGIWVSVVISYGPIYVEREFEVVGIMARTSFISGIMGASFAIAPLKVLQEMTDKEGFINYIFVKVDDRKLVDDVARNIRKYYPGAGIIKQTDIIRIILRVMDIIHGMLMAVTLIGLLVAAIGVMNTVMMSIRERIREIGILKTIGASGVHVLLIFLSEVVVMGIAGGILGIILGYTGSYFLRDFINMLGLTFNIPIQPVPESFIMGFTISITVSILAALYPIYKAIKIRPIEALKIE